MASPGWKYSEFCQESVKSENQIFIFITLCPSVHCKFFLAQESTGNTQSFFDKRF